MSIPDSCPVAFKEWAGVCDALADGRQCVIFRKGGVQEEEGPGLFSASHNVFWLYPTYVHQAEQGLRIAAPEPPAGIASTVPISALVVVSDIYRVFDTSLLPALESFHVWTEETVLKRFHYRSPGLWVLAARVYRLPEPRPLAVTPDHAGCKTWVGLDTPLPTAGLTPALDRETFAERHAALHAILATGCREGAGA